MGKVFEVYVDSAKVFCCRQCKAQLSVNVCTGPPEERTLMTGEHVVVDLFCNTCWSPVGWKYEEAQDPSQKYKEGKFILELAKTHRGD
uniref:Protein yippee-like n=1 Tax=Globisporangium ultimum (strain ATCC 200006 / CBS 805.95 / DAOM BR144) TaxID=431595 RepID=K3XBN4_GLOUD